MSTVPTRPVSLDLFVCMTAELQLLLALAVEPHESAVVVKQERAAAFQEKALLDAGHRFTIRFLKSRFMVYDEAVTGVAKRARPMARTPKQELPCSGIDKIADLLAIVDAGSVEHPGEHPGDRVRGAVRECIGGYLPGKLARLRSKGEAFSMF